MKQWLIWLPLALLGCASTPERYVAPPLPPEPPYQHRHAPSVPSGLDAQREILALMASDPVPDISPKASRQAVMEANARAVVRPRRSNLYRAVVVYDYKDGEIYQIDTRDKMPTHLVFSYPETVAYVQPDEWFEVVVKVIGEEPNQQTHVVITPRTTDLDAIMTVLTNVNAYHLQVKSYATGGMIAVRWKRPEAHHPLPAVLNPGLYYTGYDIQVTQGSPEWTPEEVWDTGLGGHTLIKFPERSSVSDVPTLYALAADGKAHLVNWSKRGDWYVVNRLLTRAELRVGQEEVVRLVRGSSYRAVWCPSPQVTCPEGGL